jgi:8-oxo-dGTP pyrophosphatase MutT (NUDIX family)
MTDATVMILTDPTSSILLLKRNKVGRDESLWGLWGFPGGRLDSNETPQDACVRELKEETGISLSPVLLSEPELVKSEDYQIYVFRHSVTKRPSVHLSGEHTEWEWFHPTGAVLLGLAGPLTRALIQEIHDNMCLKCYDWGWIHLMHPARPGVCMQSIPCDKCNPEGKIRRQEPDITISPIKGEQIA